MVKLIQKKPEKKMSEAKKGKTFSEEHRRKLSEVNKNPSKETRRKIGAASKGRRWWNDGCGNTEFVVKCPGDGWKLGRK
jgi:hypothetical protein